MIKLVPNCRNILISNYGTDTVFVAPDTGSCNLNAFPIEAGSCLLFAGILSDNSENDIWVIANSTTQDIRMIITVNTEQYIGTLEL